MEHLGKRIFSFLKTRKEEAAPVSFMENGSALLEELIVSFNGKHKIPIRHFTGEELIQATDDFRDCAVVTETATIFGGSFKQRRILINESCDVYGLTMTLTDVIHDIVITSQMSHHKNVLKLVGCCLDRRIPAVVYEYAGTELLPYLLYNRKGSTGLDRSFLSWKRRLKIAKDIANVILYLHTAFRTPIIYRDIIMENVFMDQHGSAKLFNFSLCIVLPPGESQIKDIVRGKAGYTAPDYIMTGIVSEKLDVYSFGIFLLQLLTGDEPFGMAGNVMTPHLVDRVKTFVDKDQFYKILDHNLLGEEGGIEKEDHFRTCLALALSCSQEKGEDRPEMIDVAKEIKRIERVKCGRGAVGSRMDETGPYLPLAQIPRGISQQSRINVAAREEWEHHANIRLEKTSRLKSLNSSEDEYFEDKHKKTKKASSSKHNRKQKRNLRIRREIGRRRDEINNASESCFVYLGVFQST